MLVAVKLVKNAHIDKYKYSGYATGFNWHETFSVANVFGKNEVFFGANMSSSVHVGNNKKDILTLGVGLAQGLDNTTLTSEKRYLISCTESVVSLNQLYWVVLSLHYNGANSYFFANGIEIHKFKAKILKSRFMILMLIMILFQLMMY